MRNNDKLYFDIWRKANFKELLMAYVKTFAIYTKDECAVGLGEQLDRYTQVGRGTYGINSWTSAYTISRELGVYKDTEEENNHYQLSGLAVLLLHSKITGSQYLANYALNFNQLINGQVIHPLSKILDLFDEETTVITKNLIGNIPEFNLNNATPANRNQMVNVFCNRLVEAKILQKVNQNFSLGIYSLRDLRTNCKIWEGTVNDFIHLNHNGYVDMIAHPSPLLAV